LKLDKSFKELLQFRNSKVKITHIIFGKQELKPEEMKFLTGLQFVNLQFKEDLHAKCYLNENKMIITSLNLYDFSMVNNREMGILIDRNDSNDTDLYDAAMKEVDFIYQTSEKFEISSSKIQINKRKPIGKKVSTSTPLGDAFCIRCKTKIKLNPLVPYCKKCFSLWKKYGNEEYKEKNCHICGKENNSTMLKPTCYPCYKKHHNKLEFPIA
jgi:phosphatidylserine/phosphatidylglycerophosphate/cardiolipin synthase-like enzyme